MLPVTSPPSTGQQLGYMRQSQIVYGIVCVWGGGRGGGQLRKLCVVMWAVGDGSI